MALSDGNGQSTLTNTLFALPLQVTVSSATGEPVGPGGVISYTAPSFGASLTKTVYTAATSGSGVASVTVTANSITGTYSVTVTARGISNMVVFSLTNDVSGGGNIYLPIVVKKN